MNISSPRFVANNVIGSLAGAVACSLMCFAAVAGDDLAADFKNPPQAARPRVWWHWMRGNVTEEGVKLDLEWMKRVGIGGVQNFDGAFLTGGRFDTPIIVDKPLAYLTPEWRKAFRYSVDLADELGLEFAIASSAGWTLTGGPWVKPQQAMKKLVWSETWVTGGKRFKGRLPKPPDITGEFQNIPRVLHAGQHALPNYYADVATIAYRVPASELGLNALAPTVTTSAGEPIDAARLYDGDLATTQALPLGEGDQAWIQFEFAKPQQIQALTFAIERPTDYPIQSPGPDGWLESSDDGKTFHRLAMLPKTGVVEGNALEQTLSFTPVAARVFRLSLERPRPAAGKAPPTAHQIAELVLHTGGRVNRFEDKAGFSTRQILDDDDTPTPAANSVVLQREVIDLTHKMRRDGSLDWTPPHGRWIVQRFGYSLTGRINEPASAEGTGLEVDKLHREHVKKYIETYLGEFEKTLGPELMGKKGLRYMLTDSYEAGPQNWTDDMLKQFKERRGYDLRPWLPVLAGRIVDSPAASDRLLWDFRKTLGELLVEAHYQQITDSLHARGLARYGESQEYRRFMVGDGIMLEKAADIPMGAMWATAAPALQYNYNADLREAAAVAHIYGQNLVAAESFTASGRAYAFAPQDLKPVADRMMANGVNRFVIHTSAHQPDSKLGPGIGLGPFGQWFTRKETWAEQAGPWVDYLTRSSYLLQQGRYVADVAYLYGEDTNITSLFFDRAPPIPPGYNFDFINADALINEVQVKDGKLTTRSGMEYRVLTLDPSTRRMSLALLRKIRELVQAGAVVMGPQPTATPSLADDEQEFRALVSKLWGEPSDGGAQVITGRTLREVLDMTKVPADVVFTRPADMEMRFLHRALPDGDLYFLSGSNAQPQTIEASFRITGRRPQLWRADTGLMRPVSYRIQNGRTIVPLTLETNDAVFVVFREPTTVESASIIEPTIERLAVIDGPWDISFPSDRGAPEGAYLERLASWTESPDPGIKYFSGTATYRKLIQVQSRWLKGPGRLQLDLGEVKNLAEVIVNGHPVGILWKSPFRIDISDALKPGDNFVEIKVTNLWPNRLIGDKQPGARQYLFTTFDPYKADSPLLPSGLLGPVALLREIRQNP